MRDAGWFFGLVLILSLPFYALGLTHTALPFAAALPLSALMAVVPMCAAFILVLRKRGAIAAGTLFMSAFHIRTIPHVRWAVIATAFMPVAFAVTAGMVWLSGTALPALHLLPLTAIIPAFALFFIGAVGEELGWQGYAFPALTKRHSALTAALIIGTVWALWHIIPFALMGRSAEWIIWQSVGMVLMRIIIVWLVVNAGGSILVAVLFHMMSNSVWGMFANFDPHYDPMVLCLVLLAFVGIGLLVWRPSAPRRRGLTLLLLAIAVIGVVFSTLIRTGLPMRALPLPDGRLIGAANDVATDPTRPDLFSGAAQRIVPFQMLYPASAPGIYAPYMPDAGPQVNAIVKSHGWISGVLLGQIGAFAAPWTNMAKPADGGPFPVIIYVPGVTGYMQMGSFQTTELAAHGYIVVTLDQPGAVAAVVLPGHHIVVGLTREDATSLIAPSYRATDRSLPADFAASLAPQTSIIPYFAADIPTIIDRLVQINADPAHILHGLLDLDHIGVMGMSLGAIVTAQACAMDARIDACLMMDAPVPTDVAAIGLRQPALWISRPAEDQRLERAASGGWPEDEIDAQTATIAAALANSEHGQLVQLRGLFHIDFTDVPAIQPIIGWLGQSGPAGVVEAHHQINQRTLAFFAKAFAPVLR
jgi:membrane protease YdiL (CAAX protease family)